MAVDPVAVDFFTKQLEDPENSVCCDCGEEEATWVSVSHGIYLSIGAAGLHRSLGVKISFVQSTTMDSWKPKHLKMMELGGNRRFNEFLKEQGVPLDTPVREKYSTRAAQWYREDLNARAEGLEPLAPPPAGTGHLPSETCSSSMQHVLDEVFAESPRRGSMTRGGVRQGLSEEVLSPKLAKTRVWQRQVCQEEPRDVSDVTRSKTICERLSDCFRLRRRSTEAMHLCDSSVLADSFDSSAVKSSSTSDSSFDLPTLLSSPKSADAKRLQLSAADFPSHLATPEEVSCQVAK